MMIPGRATCPGAMLPAYDGWLMSAARSSHNQARAISNHICVDKNVVTMPGLTDNSTVKLSHVRFGSSCGSVGSPCTSYTRLQDMPCTVCYLRWFVGYLRQIRAIRAWRCPNFNFNTIIPIEINVFHNNTDFALFWNISELVYIKSKIDNFVMNI